MAVNSTCVAAVCRVQMDHSNVDHAHTHTFVLLWHTLSNHGRRVGPRLKGLGAVYSHSFAGEVASLTPDLPWTGWLLGA